MTLLEPHRANRARLPRAVLLTHADSKSHALWAACCALVVALAVCAQTVGAVDERKPAAAEPAAEAPVFTATADGGYTFDTGVLRGKLHTKDKMLGLTDVIHVPTGRSVAGRWGLMHLYRIFSGGRRFGYGARDWPTNSRLLDDGAVEVLWPPAPDRPFELRALYRWHDPAALDVIITARAVDDLPTFEVFLASYFDAGLADPYIYVKQQGETGRDSGFLLGDRALGHWLVSARDAAAVALIRDGRWQVKPSPVDWAILPPLAAPVALRRDRQSDLAAIMMAPKADCFAVFMPFAGEGHYSLYLSLFGHDIAAGEQAQARARLVVGAGLSDADVVDYYQHFEQERSPP